MQSPSMEWVFFLVLTAAASSVLTAWLVTGSRVPWRRPAAWLIVSVLVVVALAIFWRQVLSAVAVMGLTLLAFAVMFQRVPPAKALASAVVALILVFGFSWLALQLRDVFFLGKRIPTGVWSGQFELDLIPSVALTWHQGTTMTALVGILLALIVWRRRLGVAAGLLSLLLISWIVAQLFTDAGSSLDPWPPQIRSFRPLLLPTLLIALIVRAFADSRTRRGP